MNELTNGEKNKLCVISKSAKKLEAEICWAFFTCVSTLTENPNQIMRGKGFHCALIPIRLRLIRLVLFLPFRKELVQSFLSFSGFSSLFYTLPQASSPFLCLSPEALPVSWLARIYAPASPLWGSKIHRQPKQQIRLRVFIARLIPRQQVVVPVSAHSVSQLKQDWSESIRELIGQTPSYRRRGEVNGKEWLQKEKQLLTLWVFFFFWRKQRQRVAGLPNTLLLSAPLSALSQRNG